MSHHIHVTNYDIWVDFNDLGMIQPDHAYSLMKYATNPDRIVEDARVIVGDGEGNTCEATVHAVQEQIVSLFLHTDTFKMKESS